MATGGAALAPVLSSQSSQREAGMGCAGGVTLMSPGHQGYTPGHLCPPQQPSTGHRAPSGPGAVLGSHFPGPAGPFLLMFLVPSQPFTRQKADVSLTSAPCCWQHGILPCLTSHRWAEGLS